jgi:sRNA-binding regulator protein Hfq
MATEPKTGEGRTDSAQAASGRRKFVPHGTQGGWLDAAQGRAIKVQLVSGAALTGRLISHDLYCLALDQAGEPGLTLIYKSAIAYLSHDDGPQTRQG